MSSLHGHIPCLGELETGPQTGRNKALRAPPACDFAEGRVWAALGGGWHCLYGCYCQCGVSIEWHDFTCGEAVDWSRSFHPESVEVCLNVSGHARMECGDESAVLGPMTAAVYHTARGNPVAWRLAGEQHQFLTVEYSRGYLERQLKGRELALQPAVRGFVRGSGEGAGLGGVFRLTVGMRKSIEAFRRPPVAGAALGIWYQGKALEVAAEFFFVRGELGCTAESRQTEVGRRRVERAIGVLVKRLAEPPTLEELGREVGCSPYHLSRTFSKEMGMTIPQYLRQVRMERAAELLKSGKFNVTEAALEVGYSSLSHFSEAFCETMGCCPGLYPLGLMRPQLRTQRTSASQRQ